MSASNAPRRVLPAHPSQEHLRKQAKRRAKAGALQLADAQRALAAEYGYGNWAELMRAVEAAAPGASPAAPRGTALSPLSEAAARADLEEVRRLLAAGEPANGRDDEIDSPLWHVCRSDAPLAPRLAIAALLLEAGASPRLANTNGATALHAAAWRGPLAMVELLIRRGALSWQGDKDGKAALDHARAGVAADKAQIGELLDRPVIRDPLFRQAVQAIHRGDVATLGKLLDAHPRLLGERAVEPDCYPRGYFRDPKLFWFVANNPTLTPKLPANIVEIAEIMIARGVERVDLDYALELVMTNNHAREQGLQLPLLTLLVEAGAAPTPHAILMTLGHKETPPIETLLERGLALTAPIAAALGRNDHLRSLLASAAPADIQSALGMAVINGEVEAARLCLDAGADPDAFLPVHAHSTPLHQAALDGNLELMKLLIARGARHDVRDTLWNGTPLGWAVHNGKAEAERIFARFPFRDASGIGAKFLTLRQNRRFARG